MSNLSTKTHCPKCAQPWSAHDFGVPKPYCPDVPAPVPTSTATEAFYNAMDMQDLEFGHKYREAKKRMQLMEWEIAGQEEKIEYLEQKLTEKKAEPFDTIP